MTGAVVVGAAVGGVLATILLAGLVALVVIVLAEEL
jgi:hypothetical protein